MIFSRKCNTNLADTSKQIFGYEIASSGYNELETAGFGLKVLKLLRNTLSEVACANNIPHDEAVQKFCKDIEEQYDDKLGFESKLNNVRSEIDSVTSSLSIARAVLFAQPVIGLSLKKLFAEGMGEHEIIELANLFERSNDADKQALLGGLQKYRTLKRGVEILNAKKCNISLGHLDKLLFHIPMVHTSGQMFESKRTGV